MNENNLPVCIDLFAGPGGLGEGFAQQGFPIGISVEKEQIECETLFRRKLFKLLVGSGREEAATLLFNNSLKRKDIHALFPNEAKTAELQVAQLELGFVPFVEVYKRIADALSKFPSKETILLGGPPCQAYSIVGRARNIGKQKVAENPNVLEDFYRDARHTLYKEYLKVLSAFGPKMFIMENVKGILSARTGPEARRGSVIDNIICDLVEPSRALGSDIGFLEELKLLGIKGTDFKYVLVPLVEKSVDDLLGDFDNAQDPSDFLIRSEDHGVPQTRHRVIICGIREDVYEAHGTLKKLSLANSPTTVEHIIKDLPRLRSEITRQNVKEEEWASLVKQEIENLASIKFPDVQDVAPTESKPSKARIRGNPELSAFIEDTSVKINGHKTRSHMISDLARYYFCADFAEREGRSPKIHDWPIGKLAPDHKDIKREGNRLSTSGFSDRFKVQVWDRPASTVTSHISKDGHYFIHPDKTQCRSLSVREAARIQTFPDSYHFCGGISKQFHQIGNAVPPYLAFQIAGLLVDYLRKH